MKIEEITSAAALLYQRKNELANLITEVQFKKQPALALKWGRIGKEKCLEDTYYHLSYLIEALRFDTPELFVSYVEWARLMLESRKIPLEDLVHNIELTKDCCRKLLPSEVAAEIEVYLNMGQEKLLHQHPVQASYLGVDNPLSHAAQLYLGLLLQGNKKAAGQIILDLIENGESITDIYNHVFRNTQYEIGLLWQTNKITVAHEHFCTAATQTIIASLYQFIFPHSEKKGKLLACTISGDLHELGIRLLTDEFEMQGWDTYYMGASMPDTHILNAIIEQKPDVLAISATMPFHLKKVEDLILKVRTNQTLAPLKILVGGYPFNLAPQLSKKVGANASAICTIEAVALANDMLSFH